MRTGEFTSKEGGERGFTLMELLIVVAIIGVLVAIAIPIFTSQLERSREAVDIANSRSAIAVAAAGYMDGTLEEGTTYYYDLSGTFTTTKPEPYGRGTASDAGTTFPDNEFRMSYAPGSDYTQSVIVAKLYEGDTYPTVKWDKVGISTDTALAVIQALSYSNGNLPGGDFWSETVYFGSNKANEEYKMNYFAERFEAAGIDSSTFSFQRGNGDGFLYVTLDGKLSTEDIGSTVRVVRYDPDTKTYEVGTATVTGPGDLNSRASVGIKPGSFVQES